MKKEELSVSKKRCFIGVCDSKGPEKAGFKLATFFFLTKELYNLLKTSAFIKGSKPAIESYMKYYDNKNENRNVLL